jgi:hypothetical protein
MHKALSSIPGTTKKEKYYNESKTYKFSNFFGLLGRAPDCNCQEHTVYKLTT